MRSTVRVGTYNLYLGADLNLLLGAQTEEELAAHRSEVMRQLEVTAFPRRVGALAGVLSRESLDLVGLQEVCTWTSEGQRLWDFAADLLKTLAALDQPYELVAEQPTFDGEGDVLVGDRRVRLRVQGSNTILRRVDSPVRVDSTDVGMFDRALHVPAMGYLDFSIDRGWSAARCSLDGAGPFTFVNTHTEAYDEGSRNGQRDELLAVLPDGEEPVVLVGDFNSVPSRIGMPEDLVDAWVAAGHPEGPEGATCGQAADLSNAESTLSDRIDYVWVRGARVRGCRRFGADPSDRGETGLWPSDHAGVAAEIELPS